MNFGKKFLHLIEKHFPKNHRCHKIINKNTVKVSYSCMKNIENILKSHNKELLHQHQNSETKVIRQCNCRSKNSCPLNGKCLTESLVYSAKLKLQVKISHTLGWRKGLSKPDTIITMHHFAYLNIKVPRNYQKRCGHLKIMGPPTTSDGILSNAAHIIRMGTSIVTFAVAQLKKSK